MNDQQLKKQNITILGGGSMGTALGKLICNTGRKATMWVYENDLCQRINLNKENDIFLPGVKLPSSLLATSSIEEAMRHGDIIISATPSQVLRQVWQQAKKHLQPDAVIVSTSKGVETGTGLLMSEVFEEVLAGRQDKPAYLSGPSFAKEIALGHPTAVVVASENIKLATQIQHLMSTSSFRIYTTDDVVGVETGGALKNVIAIAVGAAQGLNLGMNSRAALITRGLAEVTRLAVSCGAKPLTLSGLAGMGDLVLTCNGHLSRNLQVGIRLGQGETLKEILTGMKMVAEGVATAKSTSELAEKHNIEMPITNIVVQMLSGETTPAKAVGALMDRRLRHEREH